MAEQKSKILASEHFGTVLLHGIPNHHDGASRRLVDGGILEPAPATLCCTRSHRLGDLASTQLSNDQATDGANTLAAVRHDESVHRPNLRCPRGVAVTGESNRRSA